MNKTKSLLLLGALLCAFGLTSCCSSDDSSSETPSNPGTENGGGGDNGGTQFAQKGVIEGFVHDTKGTSLQGITVTSGDVTTTTDQNGFFALTKVARNGNRAIVKFSSPSYADVVRSFNYKEGETWDVVMISKYSDYGVTSPSKTEYNIESTQDKPIQVSSDAATTTKTMEVELKGEGYKDAETGAAFTGKLNATVTYLDPDAENFADQMPGGDLAAEDKNGQEVQLVSYGMTAVSLTDQNGKPLQLTGDKPAELTFPVPESIKDMRTEDRPATIPLWSFDETKGVWVEEGVATYDSANDVYKGSVKHFSWVNLDYPEVRATVKGVVKDEAGNIIPHIKVYIGQTSAITNENGEYQANIPKDTKVRIWIRSFDYGNYAEDESKLVYVDVPEQSAGATYTANIVLPNLGQVTGTVVNEGTGGNIATVWLEYNQNGQKFETKKIRTGEKGGFTLQAPVGYTGEAVVRVSTAEGTTIAKAIQLTGGNVNAGTITVKSNKSENGSLSLKLQSGQTITAKINAIDYYSKGGVTINGDNMQVELNIEMDWERLEKEGGYALHMHGFNIQGYTPTKKTYEITQFQMALMSYGEDKGGENWIFFPTLTINVERNGDKFSFTIPDNTGKMQIYDEQGDREESVTLSGSFTVDFYYEGVQATNVASTDTRIPSFIKPLLTDALQTATAPYAYFITNSPKLGKGVNLAFNGTIENFNAIKEEAAKLGMKDYSADMGNGYDNLAVYYTDGKLLKINYYQYSYNGAQSPSGINDMFSPINIVALDGTIFYITDLNYFIKKDRPNIWE